MIFLHILSLVILFSKKMNKCNGRHTKRYKNLIFLINHKIFYKKIGLKCVTTSHMVGSDIKQLYYYVLWFICILWAENWITPSVSAITWKSLFTKKKLKKNSGDLRLIFSSIWGHIKWIGHIWVFIESISENMCLG